MNSQRGQAVLISLQAQRNARLAFLRGALAQLGERLICIQEVIGSIPIGSTKSSLRPALVPTVGFWRWRSRCGWIARLHQSFTEFGSLNSGQARVGSSGG